MDRMDGVFRDIVAVVKCSVCASDSFWRTIYGQGIWIPRAVAQQLVVDGWKLSDGYSTLASLCSKAGFYGYQVRPKVHMLAHIVLDIQHQLMIPECEWILNPAINMTWSDEDFIGRVSRVSRRTHSATTARRTIDRCLGLYRRQWISIFSSSYKDPPGES